jgi:hypothetical protein
MLPYWTGEVDESPRKQYLCFSDEGDLCAARIFHWKIVWLEQRSTGTLQVWREPYTALRIPLIFNLRTDPFERANLTSNTYEDWFIDDPRDGCPTGLGRRQHPRRLDDRLPGSVIAETPHRGKNLRGRSFVGEDHRSADFAGADLRAADFSGADLTASQPR